MRRAARIDGPQAEGARVLRQCGCSVQVLTPHNAHDAGLPDMLVGRNGVNHLLEWKKEGEPLSDKQTDWHRSWRGMKVVTVHDTQEALAAVGIISHDYRGNV